MKTPATDDTVSVGLLPEGSGLSRYRVLRHLGQGGMGTLSLASDGSGRTVVLKRPLPGRVTAQALALAKREAAIASSLAHQGIVRVLDVVDDDGVPVLVMEHLEGLTLHEIARRARRTGGVPLEPLLDALAQASRALHYLHTRTDDDGRPRGLVHRDISPDNLFVTRDGITKLLDFGVARADDLDELTRVGGLRGKRGFFAPELIQGQGADARTDLFALGVTAYTLLCGGNLPWGRLDPGPAFVAMQAGPPPAPSTSNRFIPAAIDEIVLRLLAVDREARFESGDEVAALLEALLGRVPAAVRSPARLIDRFATADDEATAVEAAPARLDPTRPAQRWDDDGASALEDEESSAAMARPTGSLRAQPTLQVLGVPAPGTRQSGATSATRSWPDRAAGFDEPAPTSPSQAARRRTSSPEPGRGRTVGVVVGAALGVAVLVAVGVRVGQDAPSTTSSPVTPLSAVPLTPPLGVLPAAPPPPPPEAPPSPPEPPVLPPPEVPTAEVPTPPPAPPPMSRPDVRTARRGARITVEGPARVQWLVGGRVARSGNGVVDVPSGARTIQARDPRRGVTSTVPIVDDRADYDALPRVSLLLRARPWALVALGEESLGQTPLQPVQVVPGRYTVRFARPGKVVSRTVDVTAGAGTVKVNVEMDEDGGG